ncbi:hypothetical protein H8E77_35360 [bacterium]|nr:hypothetical protein [bacterium]
MIVSNLFPSLDRIAGQALLEAVHEAEGCEERSNLPREARIAMKTKISEFY